MLAAVATFVKLNPSAEDFARFTITATGSGIALGFLLHRWCRIPVSRSDPGSWVSCARLAVVVSVFCSYKRELHTHAYYRLIGNLI